MQAILKYKNWRQIIYSCLMTLWASLVAQLVKKKIHLQFRRPQFSPWVGKIPRRRDRLPTPAFMASLVAQTVKNSPAMQETWVQSLVGKILWRRAWLPTPVFLPGESPWTESYGVTKSQTPDEAQHNELIRTSLVAHKVKNLPLMQKTQVRSPGQEEPLEKSMAIHSSILVWKIPIDRGAWQAIWGLKEPDMTE